MGRARVVLTLAACAGLLVVSAPPAAAAGSITVDPASALASGASVTVTVADLDPFVSVVVAQCRPDGTGAVTGPGQCADPATGASVVGSTDASGSLETTLKVKVGDIRSGVSCADQECVIAAIPTNAGGQIVLAPITLTGSGTALPGPTTSTTPTPSASPSAEPSPTRSESVTAQPTETAEPTPTPEPATTQAAGNAGGKPSARLPRTGPEDAGRSFLIGLVVLQVGLIAAFRARRGRLGSTSAGRHRG
jgi:hypothetical protein